MIITFCGHAQFAKTKEYERKILDFLERHIGNSPADCYLGDYGEFDHFAYDCCKKYKASHPDVSLILITPYITAPNQHNRLTSQKQLYDGIIYPSLENKPLKFAISYRNRWMVEQADAVICGISHPWGGAYQTYQHAKRKGKPIFNVTGMIF